MWNDFVIISKMYFAKVHDINGDDKQYNFNGLPGIKLKVSLTKINTNNEHVI